LISNGIWEIAEDRDGNIWVGTNRGLHRLTPHTMTPLLEHGLVRAVAAAPDGGVWLGTPGGVMRLGGGGEAARRIPAAVSVDASSLSVDPTGTLWVASDRSIWRLGAERLYGPIVDGRRGIRSIAGDGRGGVWVVDADGQLQRWHDGRLTSVALGQDTTTSRVAFVHVDRELRVWIAFEDDPLLLMEPEGSARVVRASDGPTVSPPTAVSTIAEDRDGTIWMGTRRGLARYRDGRLAVLTTTSGVFAQSVRALVVDDLGYVWLGVGTSIARLDPAEFDRALADPTRPVKLREFDVSDGVAGVMVSSGNSGAARAADGRLFFVTGRGITMTDPRVVDERLHPPSSAVRILSVFADDERCGAAAVLPAGTSHLRIDYTVPTLTAPERARFRYRLEGFDHAWIDAGIRRQAFYTNLPSGRYRFLVQVQLPNQAWASEWTEWGFRIAPAFYESAWFYAACSVALVAAAGGVWRMRVQSLRRELAAVYGERMRLGREIHDTLLQSLAGLALQLDAVEHRLATAEQDAGPRHLARIRQQIENHVREVRQSIWDLRSRPPQPRVLGQALADCIRPLVPESVHLDVTVTGATRACPEHVEGELLRIAREAVINAVRHGKPRHIVVGLLIERRALRLTVQDDGCGFEPAARTAGDEAHYGLAAMKERATSVGGTCDVTSSAGEGARVEVVLPLRARWRWGR
jgi:signal transduction histidine kinase